jgi:hypothetical protein
MNARPITLTRTRVIGPLVFAILATTGCVAADIHTPEVSHRVIEYHSVGASETRIIRHRDGHTIIHRDDSGTDVTTQRNPGSIAPTAEWERVAPPEERFAWPREHLRVDAPAAATSRNSPPQDSGLREAYRERMLERLSGSSR